MCSCIDDSSRFCSDITDSAFASIIDNAPLCSGQNEIARDQCTTVTVGVVS